MTLLSLLFALPASADTVTPVRHCMYGEGYREVDGGSSVMVTAPEGYLIESYCVDGSGRRGRSEVHVLSTPQRTTLVQHSEGRRIEGYSVSYTRASASDEPDADPEEDPEDDRDDDRDDDRGDRGDLDENGEPSKPAEDKAEQSAQADDEGSAAAGAAEKREQTERTPSPSATASASEPRRQPSSDISTQPDISAQMTALSDGEELRITALEEDEDEDLRSLVVAGGIIIVGLLAGLIALVVRLPGQR